MATKVYNLNGGLYSGDAFTAFETRIASSNNGNIVASPSDLKVSAGSGMNVIISTGAGIIGDGTLSGVRFAIDAPFNISVNAASTANPRMDSVVAYIDKSVSTSTSVVDNTGLGIVKFKSVAGTPASTPNAPSTATIQSSIGAGNPYMVLANITVPKNATAASSFTITDTRATVADAVITEGTVGNAAIVDNAVTTDKLADEAVTSDKIDWPTLRYFVVGDRGASMEVTTGGTTILSIANVPAGTYHALAVGSFNRTGTGSGDVFMKLFLDSTEALTLAQMSVSQNWGWVLPAVVGQNVVTISSPRTISVKAFKGTNELTGLQSVQNGCSLLLIRLD